MHTLKGPLPPPPNPQEVQPTILQHSYTKRTPHPPPPYPQPTGSTTHYLTTLIHPQSYNTHTLKGPLPPPLPPTHRKYHPPSYNTHTPTILQHSYSKGTPAATPTPNPKEVPPTILQHSYTHNLTTLIH